MTKKDGKDSHTIDAGDHDGSIYYFAYGPVVNEMVRQRRGIKTTEIRLAYLPEYRLTFAIGGLANIVPRRGYDVHGLLIKLEDEQDWKILQEFDAGSTPSIREVIPYHDGYCIDDADTPVPYQKPIRAHLVEFSEHVEDRLLDSPIEHLPSDRYLNLIAQGMRQHRVDSDYVDNEILAIPFLPKRQPEEFERLPHKRKFLPKISFKKYLDLCRKEEGKYIFFILQNGVFRTITVQPDFEDPAARWLQRNGHGQPDCSLMFHKMLVDPDIPLCDKLCEMTPLHFAWVENHVVELTQQYNFKCHKVAILKKEPWNCTTRIHQWKRPFLKRKRS